jgi:flagellar biosynthesis protein FlhF
MDIRTYLAESIHDALQMVRNDLGPDAMVLRTREVLTGGWLGLVGRRRCLEITASVESVDSRPRLRTNGPIDRGIDLCQHEKTLYRRVA